VANPDVVALTFYQLLVLDSFQRQTQEMGTAQHNQVDGCHQVSGHDDTLRANF